MSVDAPLPTVRDSGRGARRSAGPLVLAFLRQLVDEHVVLARRGVRFRSRDPKAIRTAYSAMSPAEFDGVDARQRWANWRTIPANLAEHVDGRPLLAIDLCCGGGPRHLEEILAETGFDVCRRSRSCRLDRY